MAEALRTAMKGFKTDDKALIEIIGKATCAEITAIREEYTAKFKRDLVKDLKDDCSGHFEETLVALCTDRSEYDAMLVHKAVKGLGTDEDLLDEVLCTRHPQELIDMTAAYKRLYDHNLLKAVENDTSGDLKKLYYVVLTEKRTVDSVDFNKVGEDVEALYKAGEGRIGTNEGVFIHLLASNPREYVEKLYWRYAEKYGQTLDHVVKSEFSGSLKNALLALCTPLDIYFSHRLYQSMKGLTTHDGVLIRLICSQKERALKPAAIRFLADHQKTVKAWVHAECRGDYRKLLIAVLDHFAPITEN